MALRSGVDILDIDENSHFERCTVGHSGAMQSIEPGISLRAPIGEAEVFELALTAEKKFGQSTWLRRRLLWILGVDARQRGELACEPAQGICIGGRNERRCRRWQTPDGRRNGIVRHRLGSKYPERSAGLWRLRRQARIARGDAFGRESPVPEAVA